jgi:hypothetical protein
LRKEKTGETMMRLATSEQIFDLQGARAPHSLRTALERGVRPAVGFQNPDDVVKDPHLGFHDKREILSSWASDASAVQDEPRLRWLLGTVEPVPLDEVRAAQKRLDAMEARADRTH